MQRTCLLTAVAVWCSLGRGAAGQAVRGQWDFDSANLQPTVGPPLEYFDPSGNGQAAAKTQFGTTAGFGIAPIAGQVAQVMRFPACRPNEGYILHTNAPPNGGGSFLNQYTLILDLYYPASSNGWRAIFQTNVGNANDADFFVHTSNNGLGISGQYHGTVSFNAWHRIAVTVDLAASTMAKYLNGSLVGTQSLSEGIDGRWSINSAGQPQDWVLLFTDEDDETRPGYVNSVQFRDYAMTAAEIAALGGASAGGIPLPVPPESLSLLSPNGQESWQAGTVHPITWSAQKPSGSVFIDLYSGAAYRGRIGTAAMADGTYLWNIPASIGDSSEYAVVVGASAFPDIRDASDAPFTIHGSIEPAPVITKMPMLQGPHPHEMTLLWETDLSGGTQAVEWGIAEVSENTSAAVTSTTIDAAHTVHEATFGPLQPQTLYQYRVRSGGSYSPVFSFRSAPRRATPTRIVLFADEQGYPIFRQQVPNIAAARPDLILVAGDLMNNGNSLGEWHDYWFKSLEIDDLGQTTPILFARGNHDGEGTLAYTYSALPGNEAWFAFTYGNVRYIITDTNLPTSSHPAQRGWLESELASAEAQSAQFRVVVFHKPAYTDLWDAPGYIGEGWVRDDWVPLFEQHNVDMLVCGHTHAYLRGDRNGVMHTIVGGAGNVLDTVRSFDWGFFDVLASVHHYVVVEVDRNRLTWTAWNINGSILDTFELASTTPLAAADFDADNDVDADDLANFQACTTGPRLPRSTACAPMDFDTDGDVDQTDFGLFQRCYAGAGLAPPAQCMP